MCVCVCASLQAKWLRALNQAVEQQVVMGDRVGVGGVPAAARSASYTFTREGRLKDATYSGRWLTATPHGRSVTHTGVCGSLVAEQLEHRASHQKVAGTIPG